MALGYSFQPDQQDRLKQLNQPTGALGPLASQALKILSLRLPSFLGGGRPVAPGDLLKQPVGGTPRISPVGLPTSGAAPPSRGPDQLIDLVNGAVGSPNPSFTLGQNGPPTSGGQNTYQPPTAGAGSPTGTNPNAMSGLFDFFLNRRV